ncbi:Chorion peroxidase [Pseudolycoriella hygida]|uniref:Chorion peroxidase n=1 Tax=Pseudolycoriella hygida TaxID=35572 RepID=A0A9Q0MVP6_9DIPT|nr:Chorion peroxidase [Pseudolycoriella hygida]
MQKLNQRHQYGDFHGSDTPMEFIKIIIFFVSTTTLFAITVQTKDTQNLLSKAQYLVHQSATIQNEIQNSTEHIDSIDSDLKTIYVYNNFKFDEENVTDDSSISPSYPRKLKIISTVSDNQNVSKNSKRRKSAMRNAVRTAAIEGLEAMRELYDIKEPGLIKKGFFLDINHPATKLFEFSAPDDNITHQNAKAAYANIVAAKKLQNSYKLNFSGYGRQAPVKISMRKTPLESFCPPRTQPRCTPASRRYRTHDGTCNNSRKPRWGSAQMPFHRFLAPEYSDGIENIRLSLNGGPLASARFISLLVHGSRDSDSPVTLMLAQWGQFIDHDVTSTAQPRSVNGSVPQCCGVPDQHPACATIKVPKDDPWLSPLNIRCLEFLRSAPAQRRDCLLSWREQTNQVTSFLDASTIYSSNPITAENVRVFRDGLLLFGRGPPNEDVCFRGALSNKCVRPGDSRSGEQPGLLAMHHVLVGEHNRVAIELAGLNPHWSDEKIYQEARRIIGAMVQHITYREFLPLVLGRDVCRLFDLELEREGFFQNYDIRVNPTVANSFSAAAFRFGHSLIQGSYMRSNSHNQFIDNNVTLHEENTIGDIGGPGSLHRLLRGLAIQRAQKRDEFITAELTNHLFQSNSFPFGLDLAAINIQRGRDHGLPSYTQWREPCGLSPIRDWNDLERIVGPRSSRRIQQGYKDVQDIDLFVAGLAERPVVGGLVGPTFSCIIAQQFSNLRKGDRFWYENDGFESSFTPAQLQSIRQVSLAQIICRTLGSGTIQPHIFLPHDVLSNERRSCGFGILSPIDLRPWVEIEPFVKKMPLQQQVSGSKIRNHNDDVLDKVDFTSNGMTGIQKPVVGMLSQLKTNESLVNSKLDFTNTNNKRPNKNKLRRNGQVRTTKVPTKSDDVQGEQTTKRNSVHKTHHRPKRAITEDEFNLTIPPELTDTKDTYGTNKTIQSTGHFISNRREYSYSSARPYQNYRPISDSPLANYQAHRPQNDVTIRPQNDYNNGPHSPSQSDAPYRPYARPQNDNHPYDNYKPVHEVQITPQQDYSANRPQAQHQPNRPQSDYQRPHTRPDVRPYKHKPNNRPSQTDYDYRPSSIVTSTMYNVHDQVDDDNDKPYYTTFRPQQDTVIRPPNEYNSLTNNDEPEIYIKPQSPYSIDKTTRRPQNDNSYNRPPQHDDNYNRPIQNIRPISNADDDLRPDYIEPTINSPSDVYIRPQYSLNAGQPSHENIPLDDGYINQSDRPTLIQTDTYDRPDHHSSMETTFKPMIYLDDFGLSTNNKYSTPFSYDVHTTPHYNHDNQNDDFGYNDKFPNKNKIKPNIYTLDEINGIHKVTTHRPNGFLLFGPIRTPLKNPQYEAYTYFTKFLSSLANVFSYPSVVDTEALLANQNTRQKDTHDLPLVEEKSGGIVVSSNDNELGENTTTMFDKDGYLRPEHMNLERLNLTTNSTDKNDKNSNHNEIDDFILPLLFEQNSDSNRNRPQKKRPDSDDLRDQKIADNIKTRQKRSDQTAKKRTDQTGQKQSKRTQFKHSTNKTEKPPIFMVPLEVLTKPERPDNWVMFHSVYKPPLPTVPVIQMGDDVASEIPQPLIKFEKIRKTHSMKSNG